MSFGVVFAHRMLNTVQDGHHFVALFREIEVLCSRCLIFDGIIVIAVLQLLQTRWS